MCIKIIVIAAWKVFTNLNDWKSPTNWKSPTIVGNLTGQKVKLFTVDLWYAGNFTPNSVEIHLFGESFGCLGSHFVCVVDVFAILKLSDSPTTRNILTL